MAEASKQQIPSPAFSARYDSADFGSITMASDGHSLIGLWLPEQKYFGGSIGVPLEPNEDLPVFEQAKDWLDRYFADRRPAIGELPLAPRGSAFRQRVWQKLMEIPYGCTSTYGEIARILAEESGTGKCSAQAVGGAVGHNPISIIIPCHRVVGTNGSLTGYAGGIDKKILLLQHEGVPMDGLFAPKKGTAL